MDIHANISRIIFYSTEVILFEMKIASAVMLPSWNYHVIMLYPEHNKLDVLVFAYPRGKFWV
jgi:hypothetical protein